MSSDIIVLHGKAIPVVSVRPLAGRGARGTQLGEGGCRPPGWCRTGHRCALLTGLRGGAGCGTNKRRWERAAGDGSGDLVTYSKPTGRGPREPPPHFILLPP